MSKSFLRQYKPQNFSRALAREVPDAVFVRDSHTDQQLQPNINESPPQYTKFRIEDAEVQAIARILPNSEAFLEFVREAESDLALWQLTPKYFSNGANPTEKEIFDQITIALNFWNRRDPYGSESQIQQIQDPSFLYTSEMGRSLVIDESKHAKENELGSRILKAFGSTALTDYHKFPKLLQNRLQDFAGYQGIRDIISDYLLTEYYSSRGLRSRKLLAVAGMPYMNIQVNNRRLRRKLQESGAEILSFSPYIMQVSSEWLLSNKFITDYPARVLWTQRTPYRITDLSRYGENALNDLRKVSSDLVNHIVQSEKVGEGFYDIGQEYRSKDLRHDDQAFLDFLTKYLDMFTQLWLQTVLLFLEERFYHPIFHEQQISLLAELVDFEFYRDQTGRIFGRDISKPASLGESLEYMLEAQVSLAREVFCPAVIELYKKHNRLWEVKETRYDIHSKTKIVRSTIRHQTGYRGIES